MLTVCGSLTDTGCSSFYENNCTWSINASYGLTFDYLFDPALVSINTTHLWLTGGYDKRNSAHTNSTLLLTEAGYSIHVVRDCLHAAWSEM